MAELTLPTKKELEKLYHEKGHDALVWYAWRNGLRIMTSLGRSPLPLNTIWGENTIRYIYAMCRSNILFAQWVKVQMATTVAVKNASSDVKRAIDRATDVARYSYDAKIISDDAAREALFSYDPSAKHIYTTSTKAAVDAARIAYAAADAARTARVVSKVIAIVDTDIDQAVTNVLDTIDVTTRASAADYDFVLRNHKPFNIWWGRQPLWLDGTESTISCQWQQAFDKKLRELELDFLADDLTNLWKGKSLGVHAGNYLREYSETELNDPIVLRRLILEGEGEYIHAVRVLLLGSGGAGKSSLVDRLYGKPVEYVKKSTPGINYFQHQPLDLHQHFPCLQPIKNPIDLFLWDFGGQTVFHGLHSAFLHENCVYVLVVDSRHEQAPDEWLHQIRHLAGGQAKVLLVTNWYEGCTVHQNETRLLREFPNLLDVNNFFYFSCHEPESVGLQAFVKALEQASLASQRMVLKETLIIQASLQERYQDDVFLDIDDLEMVITDITGQNDPTSLEKMIEKLQQLGFLIQVDSDSNHYCLKPAWAVDHAYELLYSPFLREANGLLKLNALRREFIKKIDRKYAKHLVDFLQERSLCRKLDYEDKRYFFPDAAPANEPAEASRLLVDKTGLTIRWDLPYVPLGFHTKLVHRLFEPNSEAYIREPTDIWRQGCILRKNNSCAVVHYLPRKSVVELILVGKWQDSSVLLNTLLVNLKTVLTSGKGITESQIHPSVVLDQQVFSVHSAERLVAVLGQVTSRPQLIEEIKAMASTGNITVTNGQVIIGDHNTQKSHSDNTTITVTADQRQIISSVMDEMLRHKANLSDDVLEAVYDVRKAVKADEKQPTEKSQSVLGKLWGGIRELTNVAKDMTDVGGFVVEHQAAIGTAVTAAAALLS